MRKILLIILAIVLLCVAPALAATCTIRGTVTDADGLPVPGAKVTLFDGDRAELTTVDTDAGGNFVISNVRVDTDVCTVRVFYNDLRQTYNNAAYFSVWYKAAGDQAIPKKDTQLETLHLSGSSSASSSPQSTPGLSATAAAFTLMLVAAGSKKRRGF